MPGIAHGKEQISTQLALEQAEYIRRRADRLGWTKSKFLVAIIEQWLSNGAKPVSPADALFPPVPYTGPAPKIGTSEGPTMGEAMPSPRKTRHSAATGKSG